MGWVWNDDDSVAAPSSAGEVTKFRGHSSDGGTRKVVRSQCRTEEVEPGKFVRKCEKTEQIFKDSIGRPSEMVQSNKEYTEEDVTHQMLKGPSPLESGERSPFSFPGLRSDIESVFPGLRSDIESIERDFLGGIGQFFHGMNEFFNSMGGPRVFDDSGPSLRNKRGIPIESQPSAEALTEKKDNGEDHFSGLATDV